MSQDVFDMKFFDLLRDEKFEEARANLAARVEKAQAGPATIAQQTACILRGEGKLDQAIKVLSAAIDDGIDEVRVCRSSRAELFLKLGRLFDAERDLEAVLGHPHFITQRFHSSAAFRIAWIKALRGDESYKSYLDRFVRPEESFIVDRMVTRENIHAAFARRSTRRPRSK